VRLPANDPLAELAAVYAEVHREALARETGQAPRQLSERIGEAEVACVAESLGPQTQRVTGIPWILPGGQLSDRGRVLDRDLLRHFGYTADPGNDERKYAYLTDVSHLWLGRAANGKLRRPSTADKDHCAPWLERELLAVRPRVVILLGRHGAPFFLKRYAGIRVERLDSVIAQALPAHIGDFTTTAVPTLHPTGAQMARGGSARAYAETARVVGEVLARS
jgi:uracil-DNA glycosylase family 4